MTEASQALFDQVYLDSGTVNPFGQPDATHTLAVSAVNFAVETSDVAGNGSTQRTYDTGSSNLHELSVFAIWTPVGHPVPALTPTAQGLLVVAMAGAAVVLRRRQ